MRIIQRSKYEYSSDVCWNTFESVTAECRGFGVGIRGWRGLRTESAQVGPAKPSAHTHAPASHAPFALQSSADAHASAQYSTHNQTIEIDDR